MAIEMLRTPRLNIFPALTDDDDAARQGANEDGGDLNACLGLGLADVLLLPSACSTELLNTHRSAQKQGLFSQNECLEYQMLLQVMGTSLLNAFQH